MNTYREYLLVMSDYVYLDHYSATTCLPSVLDLFTRLSQEYWGSSNSPHYIGQRGVYSLQKGIEQLFDVMGAKDKDHLFCLPTELALQKIFFHTYVHIGRQTGKTGLLTAMGSEKLLRGICKEFEQLGCSHRVLPISPTGQLTKEIIEQKITSTTALLSMPWADGVTGLIYPVEEIANLCREKEVILHVDASYLWGKRFFRFQDIPVHFLTIDMGKIQGIPGSGILLAKEGVFAEEGELPSVAEVVSSCVAMQERYSKFELYCLEVARLRDRLEEGILQTCPGSKVLFQKVDRLPNSSVMAFPGIYHEALAYVLHTKGIYVSCGVDRSLRLEEMLLAMGLPSTIARSAIHFSLSWETTEEQIEQAVTEIAKAVHSLQGYFSMGDACKEK